MENQFSAFGKMNFKEVTIGLLITVGVALLDLVWSGVNPVIVNLQNTHNIDLSLFTTKVNWGTAWDTALLVATAYTLTIFGTGTKTK